MKLFSLTIISFLVFTVFAYGEATPPPAQTDAPSVAEAVISGKVMIKGKTPMAFGIVLMFNKDYGPPPHPYRYWRIPDLINGTDKNGNFSVVVPEGTYYLMIAQKKPDGEIGPPKEKEFLYFHGDAKGNATPITVTAGSKLNLGVLTKSFVWSPKMVSQDKNVTAIEGVVSDVDGMPIEHAVVFGYLNPEAFGRPAFVSDRTQKNGSYQLRVFEGSTYYLKVRSVIGGGAPEAGEFQSAAKGIPPVEVSVTTGQQLKGVTLKVEKFSGKGSTGVDKPAKTWKNTGSLQTK